ncbi:MAG TPA: hypothetical protein VGN88_08680 [Phycisphaerae bacterium]|jgi:hypothetical protein
MVYHGIFKDGVVVPDGPVDLKERTRVNISPISTSSTSDASSEQSAELLKIAGIVQSGRRDGSVNHDHYIYGTSKRETSK